MAQPRTVPAPAPAAAPAAGAPAPPAPAKPPGSQPLAPAAAKPPGSQPLARIPVGPSQPRPKGDASPGPGLQVEELFGDLEMGEAGRADLDSGTILGLAPPPAPSQTKNQSRLQTAEIAPVQLDELDRAARRASADLAHGRRGARAAAVRGLDAPRDATTRPSPAVGERACLR